MEVFGKGSCRGEPLLLSLIVMAAISELGFNDMTGLVAFDFFSQVFSFLLIATILPGRNYNDLSFIMEGMKLGQIALLF